MKRARPSIWPTFFTDGGGHGGDPLPIAATTLLDWDLGGSGKLSRRAFDQPRSPPSPIFLVGFRGRFFGVNPP
jgi:hypothetical protein